MPVAIYFAVLRQTHEYFHHLRNELYTVSGLSRVGRKIDSITYFHDVRTRLYNCSLVNRKLKQNG